MEISLHIVKTEPEGLLHPVAAFSQIRVTEDLLLLSDEEIWQRYLRPALNAARNKFMELQESHADAT